MLSRTGKRVFGQENHEFFMAELVKLRNEPAQLCLVVLRGGSQYNPSAADVVKCRNAALGGELR